MDVAKVREMSDEELTAQLTAAGEAMFRIRFQKSMGNLEGLKSLGESKLTIARVKTIQRERQLKAARAASPARRQAKGAH